MEGTHDPIRSIARRGYTFVTDHHARELVLIALHPQTGVRLVVRGLVEDKPTLLSNLLELIDRGPAPRDPGRFRHHEPRGDRRDPDHQPDSRWR